GVMSYAVQGTWLGNLLNIPETPIPAFVPMIMFAILFGLSMDYEVFLLSRIREEYLRTGDNGAAVADGLAVTARVITAAAAIMVCVCGVAQPEPLAGLDVEGPVLIEVFVLAVHDGVIGLTGPCGAAPWYIEKAAGEHPVDVVRRLVAEAIGEPELVHSTSWRQGAE